MSRLVERKWRIAAIVGMIVALMCDLTAKHFAGAAMTAFARKTAGIPTEPSSHSLVHLSGVAERIGVVAALVAVGLWCVSGYRREPGSSFWVVLLTAVYVLSFFIMV